MLRHSNAMRGDCGESRNNVAIRSARRAINNDSSRCYKRSSASFLHRKLR